MGTTRKSSRLLQEDVGFGLEGCLLRTAGFALKGAMAEILGSLRSRFWLNKIAEIMESLWRLRVNSECHRPLLRACGVL